MTSPNIVIPTVYGQMLINKHDINQSGCLMRTGTSPDHDQIEMLAGIAFLWNGNDKGKKPHFVDVGANFGCFTLAMAPLCRRVDAFEAQRPLAGLLTGSVALNGHRNVYVHHLAVGANFGESVRVPDWDYDRPLNFGSIELGGEQKEPLTQPTPTPDSGEMTFVTTLDMMKEIVEGVDIIKIDVEGMEPEVLEGAKNTILFNRPIVFIEWMKCGKEPIDKFFVEKEYNCAEMGWNQLWTPKEAKL